MTIITVITEGQKKSTIGASLDKTLAVLHIKQKENTTFRDETLRKVSGAFSGMIPYYKDKS